MSTEYRRGIPSVAHVEAATRLGLEWEDNDANWAHARWRFEMRGDRLYSDCALRDANYANWAWELADDTSRNMRDATYRPIRTDGTPVDWEVLDAEVARVTQPERRGFMTVRPDRHPHRWWRVFEDPRSQIYAQLATTENAWRWGSSSEFFSWSFEYEVSRVWRTRYLIPTDEQGNPVSWESIRQPAGAQPATATPTAPTAPTQPQGFRADLWRRICEACLGGLNRVNRAVSLIDVETIDTYLRWRANSAGAQHYGGGWIFNGRVPADILARWAVYQELKPLYDIVDGAQGAAAMPRDVEAGWIAASGQPCNIWGNWTLRRDAQGLYIQNSHRVTWRPEELVYGAPLRNFAAVLDAVAEQRVAARGQRIETDGGVLFENAPTFNDVPMRGVSSFQQTLDATNRTITEIVLGSIIETPTQPSPLPRFTADELNDVDHSATTTQDNATLKRGKLPTAESIGKYREVMARRNGTVAEAVKASGIDCEIAQYVLERWAGGLSDGEAYALVYRASFMSARNDRVAKTRIDLLIAHGLSSHALDTSEPADTEAQRQRAETRERQARMAAIQAQLAAERAARVVEPQEEPTRFSLLEVDEAADPARSIEAWKAQRARNVVRPVAVPAPQPAPKRKPFEVVDAQMDGLSGSAALAVLLGRAMNAEC